MKRCKGCNIEKPLPEFYEDKNLKDGHQNKCKTCKIAAAKNWRDSNLERARKNARVWKRNNPAKVFEAVKRRRKRYPEKRRANDAVNDAIRAGRLPRAKTQKCFICKIEQASQYHHHKGYDKDHRLDVIPVCHECHSFIHKPKTVRLNV